MLVSMRRLAAALAFTALASGPAAAEPQPGHLGKGDPRLAEGQYYDDYPVEAAAGQTIRIAIVADGFMPFVQLFSPSGELTEHTQGSYADGGYGLATSWQVPTGGTWHVIVTSSYPAELDYTIELEVLP